MSDDDITNLLQLVQELRKEVKELRRQVRALEQAVMKDSHVPLNITTSVKGRNGRPTNEEWIHATRQAMRHLHDIVYLERCELAKLLAAHGAQRQAWSGRELQEVLLKLIEVLKSMDNGEQIRMYRILHQTYVESMPAKEAARALSISERQYYRDLKKAISYIVEFLQHIPWLSLDTFSPKERNRHHL